MNQPFIGHDQRTFLARPPVFGRPGRIRFRPHYLGHPNMGWPVGGVPGPWGPYGQPFYGHPYIYGYPH